MARWLLKTEPGTYSFEDLVRDGRTAWTGVKNALAQIHLKAMRQGDEALVYHTGTVKAVVGRARVVRAAYPDPSDATGKLVAVDLAPLAPLARHVTLTALKAEPTLAGWELIAQGRLSVMPVPPEAWTIVERLARTR